MSNPELPEIPAPNDDDFLDRLQKAIDVARSFKDLVVELCFIEYPNEEQPEFGTEDLDQIRTEKNLERFDMFDPLLAIQHGHYDVLVSRSPEIDRIIEIEVSIALSSANGGRGYELVTKSKLGGSAEYQYFEDAPYTYGSNSYDILHRFKIQLEQLKSSGITPSELDKIAELVDAIRQVQSKGRLKQKECDGH